MFNCTSKNLISFRAVSFYVLLLQFMITLPRISCYLYLGSQELFPPFVLTSPFRYKSKIINNVLLDSICRTAYVSRYNNESIKKRSKNQFLLAAFQPDSATKEKPKKGENQSEPEIKLETLYSEDVKRQLEYQATTTTEKEVYNMMVSPTDSTKKEILEDALLLAQLKDEKQKIEQFEVALKNANLLPSQIRHAVFQDKDENEMTRNNLANLPRRGITYLNKKTDERNEITISIPKRDTIHVRKDERCPFPNWVDSSFYTSKAPWYLQLALKTLYEERFGTNSILNSYIAMLPSKSEQFSTLYHWNEKELETYIKYQPLIKRVISQKEKWNVLIDDLFISCNYDEKKMEEKMIENDMGDMIDNYAYEYELEAKPSGEDSSFSLNYSETEIKNKNVQEAFSTANPNRMLSGGITKSAIIAAMENVLSRSFQGKFGLGIKSIFPSLFITLALGLVYTALPEVSIRLLYALDDYPWLPLLGLPILFLPAYLEFNAKEEYVMAPLIDSFNHKTRARSFLDFSSVNQQLVLKVQATDTASTSTTTTTTTPLQDFQGDPTKELFISYGRKTNDELLQFFGFVESDNPVDTFIFDNVVQKLQNKFTFDSERIAKLKSKDLFNKVNEITFQRQNNKVLLLNKQETIRGLRLLFSSEEEFFEDEELEDKIVQSPMALTVSNFEESPFDTITDNSDTQRRVQEGIEFLIAEELNYLQDDAECDGNITTKNINNNNNKRENGIESDKDSGKVFFVEESRFKLGQKFRKEKSRLLSMIKSDSQNILSMSTVE